MRFSRHKPLGALSLVILGVLVFTAVFADVIAPYDPLKNTVGPRLEGPTADHLVGTDNFGRDVFSRIVHGARISLYIGLGATLISAVIATILGATSGYLGGVFDYVAQRFVDTAQSIPGLIMLIAIMVVLGPSTQNVIIALSSRFGLAQARIIRGAVIGIRNLTYIEAAKATGASDLRVLARHVLPNVFPVVIVLISTTIGIVIVAEGLTQLPRLWRAGPCAVMGCHDERGGSLLHAYRALDADRAHSCTECRGLFDEYVR